jgi:hypothetical protein
LDGYLPNLQVGGQFVSFLTAQWASRSVRPRCSPALLEEIGNQLRLRQGLPPAAPPLVATLLSTPGATRSASLTPTSSTRIGEARTAA